MDTFLADSLASRLDDPTSDVPTSDAGTPGQAELWTEFTAAQGASAFCEAWLALQCRMVPRPEAAMLLLEDGEGSFAPAATIGHGPDAALMAPAAEQALRSRRHATLRTEAGRLHVAHPIDVRGHLWGVVVVDLGTASDAAVAPALRTLHWGAGWIETLFYRRQAELDAGRVAAARAALEMVAVVGKATSLAEAGSTMANDLATRLQCRRVGVGLVRKGHVRLLALSHTASVVRQMQLADSIANVMEEAFDANGAVAAPALPGTERRVAVAHRAHLRQAELTAVLSVPLQDRGRTVGVLTLERDAGVPFDAATLTLCEVVADLAGPVFALHRRQHRMLAGRLPRALAVSARALLGRGHPALKLGVAAAAGVAAYLCLVTGDYRVTGKAVIEGVVQRQAVAPFDGFVAASVRRAGDVVEAGEMLALLDTREMELQALRYESQMAQARLKQQEAEGKHDRAEAAIAAATAAEAQAELSLAHDRLEQARITAPFRGLLVSGDLSQMLGSPVERGKMLFEIAPLDDYRVVVQVDEREVARVRSSQTGRLVLNGLPGEGFDFDVHKIVPVAVPLEGRNTFRVEGALRGGGAALRPGMEGVGKITVGQESLIRAWSHPVLDWVRLAAWKWLP